MKLICFSILFVFILGYTANSQSISLFDIDTTQFPTIRAKFFAFDSESKPIRNLSPNDMVITEDGVQRTVKYVSCPSEIQPIPISSVLVIDASGSMSSGKPLHLDLAKSAANAWIKGLPTLSSECAVTAFDDKNYFIQDFTTNRELLLKKIEELFAGGETDYDEALINPSAGGLLLTKQAKHKKVLIMLTDGMPNQVPRVNDIVAEANRQGVTIYAVTLGFKCPQHLIDISTKTGGTWFEDVTTVDKAVAVYMALLCHTQNTAPCEIVWESSTKCKNEKVQVEVNVPSKYLSTNVSYWLPSLGYASLEFEPNVVFFRNVPPGQTRDTTMTFTSNNGKFSVSDITVSEPAFSIEPKSFVLNPGESKDITIRFSPIDSGYIYCKFQIINDLCEKEYFARGGYPGKKSPKKTLKLIRPNGAESFVAGMDTLITWADVSPDEPVSIEYSTNNGEDWITVTDEAVGLAYKWRVPNTPSNQCLVRAATKWNKNNSSLKMEFIPAGSFQMGNTGKYSGAASELPVHTVIISEPFYMSAYEVTQLIYEEVTGKNPSHLLNDSFPVENVSWLDAVNFCNLLSEQEGLDSCYTIIDDNVYCTWDADGYRLPTEAEWEYACKAGSTTDFYNGNLLHNECYPLDSNLNKIAWYCGNEGKTFRPVGKKAPNAFGLYDMLGNVQEWCWDNYGAYTEDSETDPKGANSGYQKVYRGGFMNMFASYCRSSSRGSSYINGDNTYKGFRVVRKN